jgi:hypothetical protein
MLRKLSVAVALLTIVGITTPALASDQYVMQTRKSVKTVDMDGYLAAVKKPNGRRAARCSRGS